MNIINYFIIHFILNIFVWNSLKNVFALDLVIRNSEESLISLTEFLRSNPIYEEGINIYFPDPYYSLGIHKIFVISATVESSMSFISLSQNMTIFDYGETTQSSLFFYFETEKIYSVKFYGFIFQNYSSEGTNIVSIHSPNDAYKVVFENCVFSNNIGTIIHIHLDDILCIINDPDYYQVEFNNCIFK